MSNYRPLAEELFLRWVKMGRTDLGLKEIAAEAIRAELAFFQTARQPWQGKSEDPEEPPLSDLETARLVRFFTACEELSPIIVRSEAPALGPVTFEIISKNLEGAATAFVYRNAEHRLCVSGWVMDYPVEGARSPGDWIDTTKPRVALDESEDTKEDVATVVRPMMRRLAILLGKKTFQYGNVEESVP